MSFVKFNLQQKEKAKASGRFGDYQSFDTEIRTKLGTVNRLGKKHLPVYNERLQYLTPNLEEQIDGYLTASEFTRERISRWKEQEQKDLCEKMARETQDALRGYKDLMSSKRHKLRVLITTNETERERGLRESICIGEHANILLQEMIQSSSGCTVNTEAPPAYSGKTGDSSNAEVASE